MIDAETRCSIEALIVEYAWLLDHSAADRLPSLFTESAVLELPKGRYAGAQAIAQFGRERVKATRVTRHLCSNIRLVRLGSDKVQGSVAFTVYRHDAARPAEPTVAAVGEWQDVYVKHNDARWRFAERRVVVVFETEAHRQ